jgi:hypothetical protein
MSGVRDMLDKILSIVVYVVAILLVLGLIPMGWYFNKYSSMCLEKGYPIAHLTTSFEPYCQRRNDFGADEVVKLSDL